MPTTTESLSLLYLFIIILLFKTNPKQRQRSTHYQKVKATIERAVKKGVESWNLTMNFTPTGVMLHTCENTTKKYIKIKGERP